MLRKKFAHRVAAVLFSPFLGIFSKNKWASIPLTNQADGFEQLQNFLQSKIGISESEWKDKSKHFHIQSLKKGEVLLSANQCSGNIWFLDEGLIRNVYLTKEGKEFNKSFVAAPSFCGSTRELINGQASRFSIEALEPCSIITLPIKHLHQWKAEDIKWQQLYIHYLESLLLKKEQREAELLLDDATTRYASFKKEYANLLGRIPAYQIAAYLGITEVALSRIKNRE